MKKSKPKSRAKDLEQAFWDELEKAQLSCYFERAFVLEVEPPSWIYHKPKGGKWCWEPSLKKRSWEFDFGTPDPAFKLLLEADGNTYFKGGHTSGAALENQYNKQDVAAALGWRVLRITRNMIESGVAVALVTQALFS